jgi:hydrogenase nickel incorporation protein HypA/HybF
MHERSLLAGLMRCIEDVVRREGARRVTVVHLQLGALAHISADHLREHFEHAAQGGVADGARLVITTGTDPRDPHAQDILLDRLEVET